MSIYGPSGPPANGPSGPPDLPSKSVDLTSYAKTTYVDAKDGLQVLKAGNTMTETAQNPCPSPCC